MLFWIGLIIILLIIYLIRKNTVENFQDARQVNCDYINSQRDWFQNEITAVRILAQDLSGGIWSTMDIKGENMNFQYANWEGTPDLTTYLGGPCSSSNTSPNCMKLASVDSNVVQYANITGDNSGLLEIARIKLIELDTTLTEELANLNDVADVLGCSNYSLYKSGMKLDLTYNQKTFNISRDVGDLETSILRNALQELSPYYIDPSILNILLEYLINDANFLARVNTIPANVQYINQNIESLFGTAVERGTTYIDFYNSVKNTVNFKNAQSNFLTYSNAPAPSGYYCGLDSTKNYATLFKR
jgi:hypothetical protein